MKVIPYILISVDLGESDNILRDLIKIKEVRSASVVSGIYDLIVYYRIRSIGKVLRLIVREIAQLPGVDQVSTQIILNELNKF